VRQYGHEVTFAAFSFGDTVCSTFAGSGRFALAFRPKFKFSSASTRQMRIRAVLPLSKSGEWPNGLYRRTPKGRRFV